LKGEYIMTVTHIRRPLVLANALFFSSLLLAASATAQSSMPDARWLPWLGCWQPTDAEAPDSAVASQAPVVCVVPTSAPSAVEIVTVANGTVTSRDRIQAGGQQHPREDEGCKGSERVEWSQDGRRLYRVLEHACPGGIGRRSSGLMAILPSGEWVSAQGISVAGNSDVRVLRYRPVSQTHAAVPAEIQRALAGRALAVDAARIAASAPPTTQDLVEASRRLDADVVSAWLIEREEGFAVDAQRLIELAEAGVPEPVIDVMVALSYPRVFAINRTTGTSRFRPQEQSGLTDRRRSGPTVFMDPWNRYSGYGWGYYPGYGSGYYPGYARGYYGRPVIIVRAPADGDDSQPRGRAVKGQGYTRRSGDSSTGTSSTPRPSTGSSQGSGSSTSSSGSTSQGSQGSSSDSGRTAKPRPDTN
jgi:hypothetical protein